MRDILFIKRLFTIFIKEQDSSSNLVLKGNYSYLGISVKKENSRPAKKRDRDKLGASKPGSSSYEPRKISENLPKHGGVLK